jgi:CheY-like chemotaxis protein
MQQNVAGRAPCAETIGQVLVVDDHADTREVVCELLRAEGYAVLEAENGRVALELLIAHVERVPYLLILDLEMPIMSGWELLLRLRSDHHLQRIPVLVTSAYPTRLNELSGVAGFLQKPFGPDELLRTMAAVRRHQAACASDGEQGRR